MSRERAETSAEPARLGLSLSALSMLLGAIIAIAAVVATRRGAEPVEVAVIILVSLALLGTPAYFVGSWASRLRALSLTDPLTGVANRRLLDERLAEEAARASRNHRAMSVLLVDVDRLKQINDGAGHSAGDRALREVAAALMSCTHISDVVGRYGGDEFLVIAPETDAKVGLTLAERILCEVLQRNPGAQSRVADLSLSIGIAATHPGGREDAAELLTCADHALYEAKSHGGGCAVAEPEPGAPQGLVAHSGQRRGDACGKLAR